MADTHVADTHVADKHSLGTIPDAELLRRLRDILRDSRRTESDLVAHVGEVDRRRLYAREASPSMFVYCTRVLHLSGAEAYLRITAARAARKHPMLLAMLADGRLHLSGIAKLAPCLTRENRDAILSRATHRSKREIEELVAEIAPRADVPARLRKLPDVVRREGSPPALDPASGREGCVHESGADATRAAVGDERLAAHAAAPGELSGVALVAGRKSAEELRPDGVGGPGILQPTEPPRAPALDLGRPSSRSVVEPLAPSRYRVEFTASGELRDKLERLQALLRVELPGADLSAVIDRAVSETLQRLEARRYARTRTPRTGVEVPARPARRDGSRSRGAFTTNDRTGLPPVGVSPGALQVSTQNLEAASRVGVSDVSIPRTPADSRHSRHIPAAIRRAVYERDGGRCRFVDETGRRCPERHRLEYHHLHPFGLGGRHVLENVRLLCRTHNLLEAEHDYGRQTIDRHRRGLQDARLAPGVRGAGAEPGVRGAEAEPGVQYAGAEPGTG